FSETSNCVNIPAATLGLSVVNDELTSTPNFHLPDVVPCCSCRSMDAIVDSFQPDEAVSSSVIAGETREGRVGTFSCVPITGCVSSAFNLIIALSTNSSFVINVLFIACAIG